jgi:hypothetical protein
MMVGERFTPLNSGFLVTGIIGFFVSFYLVYGWNKDFGIASMLVFAIMVGASLYSMTKTTEAEIIRTEQKGKP